MDLFKRQTTPPTSGQFIAIWTYNGKPWSSTYRFNSEGALELYNEFRDEWVLEWSGPGQGDWREGTIFFTE